MRRIPIAFTGSAQELRRRSRRDLLVNIVLGGLYTSIARRHTADYLAQQTAIDGTAPVAVPVAKSRWPAIVLVAGFVAVRLATEFGAGPPLPLLIVAGVLLVPYLWGTVTARSIAAWHWRGLPLCFGARWSEIYAASWPLFVLGLAWAIAEPTVSEAAAGGSADARFLAPAALAGLAAFPLVAALAFQYRRLRFTRTRVGEQPVEWAARFGAYLRLWCLTALAVAVTAIAPVLLLRHALLGATPLEELPVAAAAGVYGASIVLLLLLSAPARAWYEAQSFALSWHGLRLGRALRVQCALDVPAFVRMRTADAWRSLLTLGAHRSQAVVHAYEAKLAALTLWAEGAP